MTADPFDRNKESLAVDLIDAMYGGCSQGAIAEEILYRFDNCDDTHDVALALAKVMFKLRDRIIQESQSREVVRNAFIGALGVTHRRPLWRPSQIERLLLDVEHDIQTILNN